MVYLNPSRGGSRRSNSIASNPSLGKLSSEYNYNNRLSAQGARGSIEHQDGSIRDIYKLEGR